MYFNINTNVDVDLDIDDIIDQMTTGQKEELLDRLVEELGNTNEGIANAIESLAANQSSAYIWRLHTDLSDNAKEFLRKVLEGK